MPVFRDTHAMEKAKLRKRMLSAIKTIDRFSESEAIQKALLSLPELDFSDTLLAYSPLPSEPAIDWKLLGKKILYPFVCDDVMCFGDGPLIASGPFGIMEPERIEAEYDKALMAVPLLGWSHDMQRLGRGGGYYDRYIAGNRDRLLTIGLSFSVSYIPDFEGEPHDASLDIIITPSAVVRNPALKALKGTS